MSKKKNKNKNFKIKAKRAADLTAPIKVKGAGKKLNITPAELLLGAADIKEDVIAAFTAYKDGEINTDDFKEMLEKSAAETHKYVIDTMLKYAGVK